LKERGENLVAPDCYSVYFGFTAYIYFLGNGQLAFPFFLGALLVGRNNTYALVLRLQLKLLLVFQ